MLRNGHTFIMSKIYWVLLIPVFLWVSYYNIFFGWQLHDFSVNEAEDFGRYIFVLTISVCQSFFYILLIMLAVSFFLFRNKYSSS